MRFIQVAGLSISAVASLAYLSHWYYVNFQVFNVYSYKDFAYESDDRIETSMPEDIVLSENDVTVHRIMRVVGERDLSQILCLWGSDNFSNDVIIKEALRRAHARMIHLSFYQVLKMHRLFF